MKKIVSALILMAASSTAVFAAPAINIGSMHDFIEPGQSTLLKRIRNTGESTAFVRVSVAEMFFDSAGNVTEKPVNTEGVMSSKSDGLIATPTRMVIPAGGVQANRQLYVGKRDTERYYRVRFLPVLPDNPAEFAIDAQKLENYKKSMSAGVNVLSGFGAIVTVRPATLRYSSELKDGNKGFTIINNGNTTITLDNIYRCSNKEKSCGIPTVRHILPGKSLTLDKAPGYNYKFDLMEGLNKKAVKFG